MGHALGSAAGNPQRSQNEVLAAAIDHINDHRYRTLGPVVVEAEVDIFTTGISVDPTFGEFEETCAARTRASRREIRRRNTIGRADYA